MKLEDMMRKLEKPRDKLVLAAENKARPELLQLVLDSDLDWLVRDYIALDLEGREAIQRIHQEYPRVFAEEKQGIVQPKYICRILRQAQTQKFEQAKQTVENMRRSRISKKLAEDFVEYHKKEGWNRLPSFMERFDGEKIIYGTSGKYRGFYHKLQKDFGSDAQEWIPKFCEFLPTDIAARVEAIMPERLTYRGRVIKAAIDLLMYNQKTGYKSLSWFLQVWDGNEINGPDKKPHSALYRKLVSDFGKEWETKFYDMLPTELAEKIRSKIPEDVSTKDLAINAANSFVDYYQRTGDDILSGFLNYFDGKKADWKSKNPKKYHSLYQRLGAQAGSNKQEDRLPHFYELLPTELAQKVRGIVGK